MNIDVTKYDDTYLIGITNKGIVKRAYKDLEALDITHTEHENTMTLSLDDVTVTLAENVLESTCTCPSRSICKHIIMGVLYCKSISSADPKEEIALEYAALNIPEVSKLLQIIGIKRQQQLISAIQEDNLPSINEGSVVTIQLEEDYIVKLLAPIEYSICSCKSKELCKHKAMAILFYMFYKGKISLDDMIPQEVEFDFAKAILFCDVIQQEITNELVVGLARISDSIIEKMEKLAIACHNHRLATLEQKLREIGNYYDMYFKHHTHFKEEILLHKLSNAYMLADKTKTAENYGTFVTYAGVFREEYELIAQKTFIPIGERYMETLSGYAGFCYYFLEEVSLQVYSYSNIRPNFYDKNNQSNYLSEQAPWNLNCNMKTLMSKKFSIDNPKVSGDRRISSSSKINAQIIEHIDITGKYPKGSVVFDFRNLIYIDELSENDKVSIVNVSKVLYSRFDKIKQVFNMVVEDVNEFAMDIELPYTKSNEPNIKMLETYCEKPSDNTIFVGIVYLEDQKIKMFPMEYVRKWQEY